MLLTEFAVLIQVEHHINLLPVFVREVRRVPTHGARQLLEIILTHNISFYSPNYHCYRVHRDRARAW